MIGGSDFTMKQNQSYPGRSILSAMGAIGTTIFALPFVGGEILGTGMLIHALGIMVALLLISGIAFSLLSISCSRRPRQPGSACSIGSRDLGCISPLRKPMTSK